MSSQADNVVLFDGTCGLCVAWVRFIIRRDRRAAFHFAAFQSETGRQLCLRHGLEATACESVLLIRKDGVRQRSDAVLDIARQLGGAWRWLTVLSVVPRPIRDGIYDLVARNRHRWFGRNAACPVPPDDIRSRFLP